MHVSCDRSPGEEHWVPCGTDALGACDALGSAPESPRSEEGEEGPFLSPMLLVRSSRDRVGGRGHPLALAPVQHAGLDRLLQ